MIFFCRKNPRGRPTRVRSLILVLFSFLMIWEGKPAGAFFGAKHEPPDGRVYHGAQAEVRPRSLFAYGVDWEGIRKYGEAVGPYPRLIMHYYSFDPIALRLLKSTIREIGEKNYKYIPQIGLDFYSYTPGFNIMNPKDITEGIASGAYDPKIRGMARLFKEMPTEVFLRPGYEFGGNGQGRHASKIFWKAAWKRIYEILKKEGADNVAFVWNTLDAADYMDYYPGDEYVDWWAVNVFDNHADERDFINRFVRDAGNRRKPVMIAESTPRYIGSTGGEAAWRKWYEPYFNLVRRHPHLKAFCYINASWKSYPDKSFQHDCRVQSHPVVARKYRERIASREFIHAELK